ncbi:hypothetical protein BDZ97DRAFT_1772793 [Flammula alnicola]|nr:hypothetical protein BDZ97DRAFT_1772793 [Flammula alnicola]
MSLRYLTLRNALAATTQNGATTHFNHLRSIPRAWLIRRTKHDPKLKSAAPKDSTTPPPQSKNYHYSRCQLYVGDVFASRIGTSEPRWSYTQRRFLWKRYAVATVPKLLKWVPGNKIRVPWPPFVKRTYPGGGIYDTLPAYAGKVTYKLPTFDPSPTGPIPQLPAEKEYLDLIYNPDPERLYDPSAPFEVYLKPELANPHSRAKKLERWKIHQATIHATLKEITAEELKNLAGRTIRQAKADAAFKWREFIKEQQADRKKERWMHLAQVESWDKKQSKKASKEARQRRRLTELMLEDEPNQVIPASLKEAKQKA